MHNKNNDPKKYLTRISFIEMPTSFLSSASFTISSTSNGSVSVSVATDFKLASTKSLLGNTHVLKNNSEINSFNTTYDILKIFIILYSPTQTHTVYITLIRQKFNRNYSF